MGQQPELNIFGMPDWCNPMCMSMEYKPNSSSDRRVSIKSNAAHLVIIPGQSEYVSTWIVDWSIQHGIGEVSGRVILTTDQLRMAFRLKGYKDVSLPEEATEFLQKFGGDSAIPGRFIRWQRYLNVPCPGTGLRGDPNISIELDAEIREAVSKLVESVTLQEV